MKTKFPIFCLGDPARQRQPNPVCPKWYGAECRLGNPVGDALSHLILAACRDIQIHVFSQAAYADPLDTADTYILT
jgi:hypothetical protein